MDLSIIGDVPSQVGRSAGGSLLPVSTFGNDDEQSAISLLDVERPS